MVIKFFPNKNSFKLISKKKLSNKIEIHDNSSIEELTESVKDFDKRTFLKVLGMAGLGLVGASLFPKKADALIIGNQSTSGTISLKNVAGNKINPAKEDGNLATLAGKDFATETTLVGIKSGTDNLSTIKTNTDKFTFIGDSLKTIAAGGSDIVGLKDITNTQINPATDDAIVYLRRMVKLMESQATVDSGNRQRISIDATTVTQPVSGTVTVASITNLATLSGQNQQMYQDVARNAYANGIRQNIIFS